MNWTTVVPGVISVIVSVALSTAITILRERSKNNGVRRIAINALNIFLSYSNLQKTFEDAKGEFNKISIPEKRAILVALFKIGIPITTPSSSIFNITSIEFLPEKINKESIESMIEQIKRGNCDNLFYADVEEFFSEGVRMRKLRSIAQGYIKNVMSLSFIKFDDNGKPFDIIKPDNWVDLFTPGELKAIQTFIQLLVDTSYYDSQGKIKHPEMDKIISEISSGMWDNYLLWDNTAYQNMQLQKESNAASLELYKYLRQPQPQPQPQNN